MARRQGDKFRLQPSGRQVPFAAPRKSRQALAGLAEGTGHRWACGARGPPPGNHRACHCALCAHCARCCTCCHRYWRGSRGGPKPRGAAAVEEGGQQQAGLELPRFSSAPGTTTFTSMIPNVSLQVLRSLPMESPGGLAAGMGRSQQGEPLRQRDHLEDDAQELKRGAAYRCLRTHGWQSYWSCTVAVRR